jgi:predicted ATPase
MQYFDQPFPKEFEDHCLQHRYDHVVVLPPWEEIYTRDDERLESFDEARDIHEALLAMYSDFNYSSLTVPIGNIEERAAYILSKVVHTS